jgi:HTH-type transcriptional regulator/antitoxin HipB
VQTLREARGLSRAELAQRCGVGRRFIYDLERGKPTLRFDKLYAVLRVLGVSLRAQSR